MKDTFYEPEADLIFEFNGDNYVRVGKYEPKETPIGTWGQRRSSYLKKHSAGAYRGMLWAGRMNDLSHIATEIVLNDRIYC